MNPENQGFQFVDGLGGSHHYQNWVPQPQFPHGFHFLPATQVPTHGGLQFNGVAGGGYQNSLDPHCQFYSQPANCVHHQVPMLTAQQQQKHSVWLQMVKRGSSFLQCKPPFEWSEELHQKFMVAVNELGGLAKAKPAGILRKMSGYGLSRLTVKSHLQTCRRKEKTAGAGSGKRKSSIGRREDDQVLNEAASENLANSYSVEMEKENENSLFLAGLKFIEAELDKEINEEDCLEFTTPIGQSHHHVEMS